MRSSVITKFASKAFSLVEVTITIGVIAFAMVGLLGLVPLALDQSRLSVNETRGAQLARMIGTTLEGESYQNAELFEKDGTPLDFSTYTAMSPPIILFATYGAGETAQIMRTANPPTDAEYRIELRLQPAPLTTDVGSSVRGQIAQIRITAWPAEKSVAFQGTQFISRLSRSVRSP